ncbi:unnamed protein product [Prunus armeniaca]
MKALEKNHTWTLETLPQGKNIVGCRWMFTIKDNVERYNARPVVKGHIQTFGVDYEETFAPVAKLNTVRVLLSLTYNLDRPLHQFDVKNVFLHGELTKHVYMDISPEYNTTQTRIVCKLRKAMYGLKQSPRAWFGQFIMAMKNNGFKQNADWVGSVINRSSTSGYFTFVAGNLVTWMSKKQKVVPLSSA